MTSALMTERLTDKDPQPLTELQRYVPCNHVDTLTAALPFFHHRGAAEGLIEMMLDDSLL